MWNSSGSVWAHSIAEVSSSSFCTLSCTVLTLPPPAGRVRIPLKVAGDAVSVDSVNNAEPPVKCGIVVHELDLPDYMSPDELADLLHVSANTVRGWIRAGGLDAVRVGPRLWRIHRDDVYQFLHKRGK